MKKIVIIGCPSSGKTTLSNKLGNILNIPVFHLDKIFWVQKGGIKQDIFLAQQEEIMYGDKWIIDGDFIKSKSFDIRLLKADTIIYFDLSKPVIYWRIIKRYIKYFKKLRPDMGGEAKNVVDWHLIKYIWNYPAKEIYEKVRSYATTKDVVILSSTREERIFIEKLVV